MTQYVNLKITYKYTYTYAKKNGTTARIHFSPERRRLWIDHSQCETNVNID